MDVTIFEAGPKPLAKMAITGGGRCNLTNSFEGISNLREAYPRGDKLLKRVFRTFDHEDTWRWFESEGVKLTLQDDHCVFPASQDAMEIVRLLTRRMHETGVQVRTRSKVEDILPLIDEYDAVVVTTGGSPRQEGLSFLKGLDLEVVPPVPSLFTFNLPGNPVRGLMGTVVENATASLAGTPFKASGPLLITHWGMSGPAILKLSSYSARHLAEKGYQATLLVNWLSAGETEVRSRLQSLAKEYSQKLVINAHPEEVPSRLWAFQAVKSGIREDARWGEIGSKGMNRLVNTLQNDEYSVRGKSRFKEEFVTCGGVALSEIDFSTLECKKHPGIYFAGEVIDVDAITGGFNLQAAWSMGYRAAVSICTGFRN